MSEQDKKKEDLEKTKEAPAIDHTDILDGIEDLFDDREEK